MTKSQILILLLIIALAFYLTQENQPKSPPKIKKLTRPQPAEPTSINLPAAKPINLPNPKIKELLNQGWPIHFPSAQPVKEPNHPEPTKFQGLNPPHSQVVEPFEPSKPPTELEPTKKSLNCPAPEFTPDTQPSKPSSTLTPEEQLQRKTQTLSDYNWLLNNRTIDYWHYQKQLTNSQYQALLSLVSQEEMNTLTYFLNLLPANHEWLLLSPEFKNQTLTENWLNHNFTYQQTNDWLKIGLKPTDYALAAWLKNTKNLTAEEVLNFGDFEQLKKEFTNYAN